MAKAGRASAFTFNRLPSLINGTSWDSAIVKAMEEKNFETVAAERLSSGIVFGYCGRNQG